MYRVHRQVIDTASPAQWHAHSTWTAVAAVAVRIISYIGTIHFPSGDSVTETGRLGLT